MRIKKLSDRLKAVTGLVEKGSRVADIGCDHAYSAIFLVSSGISDRCIAMDVRPGPLERARVNVYKYGFEDRIELRLSDGAQKLAAGEADVLLLAGMGGLLVCEILKKDSAVTHSVPQWILQPQSEIEAVRRYIRESGYRITEENMVKEDGKYYPMLKAVRLLAEERMAERGTEALECAGFKGEVDAVIRIMDKYGPVLLTKQHPVLKEFLFRGLERLGGMERPELSEELQDINSALSFFDADLKEAEKR